MKPWRTLATATRAKSTFTLKERDGEFLVQVDGKVLMGSRRHGSEDALATVGLEYLRKGSPRVLVGGLGFGYTLRAALDVLPAGATVVVAELAQAIVAWNREFVGGLAGHPLDDRRVSIEVDDVNVILAEADPFDAILLDVDNGPVAVTQKKNRNLYDTAGVKLCQRALNPGGRLVVWSAGFDPRYERTLAAAGFSVQVRPVSGEERSQHVLFIADKRGK
ncbi:MAG: hypothetical protein ACJ790_16900 [Myxococcaceae bacterium]